MSNASKRQAVVIIHGIGEQRPMSTLRGFVKSLLEWEKYNVGKHDEKVRYWTKPDRFSKTFELRKITAKGRVGHRSTTHFYEYHWAAKIKNSKWRHVWPWLMDLMSRKELGFIQSRRIKFLLVVIPFLFAIGIGAVCSYIYVTIMDGSQGIEKFIHLQPLFLLFFSVGSLALGNIFLRYIGDAARYLRPTVQSIDNRENIRRSGVDMLKALHDSGEYDRIILVGHSLGSVIAYDLITYLWIEFNKSIDLHERDPLTMDGSETTHDDSGTGKAQQYPNYGWKSFKNPLKLDREALIDLEAWSQKYLDGAFPSDDTTVHDYQEAQSALWRQIQSEQDSWLISDFVTLGSPLAHANLLMADNQEDFEVRIQEREYPVTPPVLDNGRLSYNNVENQEFMHNGAPFAVTRWTNLYYGGDVIGGPLSRNFGPGILDERVVYHTKKSDSEKSDGHWIDKINPFTHNYYWEKKFPLESVEEKEISKGKSYTRRIFRPKFNKDDKKLKAIESLYGAMRLDDLNHNIYKLDANDVYEAAETRVSI